MKNESPASPKTNLSVEKVIYFWILQHLQKVLKMIPKWTLKLPTSLQVCCWRPPKSDAKNKYKIGHQQGCTKIKFGSQYAPKYSLRPLMFWCFVWPHLRSCLQEPLDPQNHDKFAKRNKNPLSFVSCTPAFVAACVLSRRSN